MLNGVFYNDTETSKKVLFNSYVGVPQVLLSTAYDTAHKDLWTVPYVQADLTLGAQYEQTLREKMTNMQTLAVTAKPGTFDKVWDDNLADWLASGAQTVIKERNEKYVAP
jgi:hypothetical protein